MNSPSSPCKRIGAGGSADKPATVSGYLHHLPTISYLSGPRTACNSYHQIETWEVTAADVDRDT